jgi:hypothetical protein
MSLPADQHPCVPVEDAQTGTRERETTFFMSSLFIVSLFIESLDMLSFDVESFDMVSFFISPAAKAAGANAMARPSVAAARVLIAIERVIA